MFLTVVSYVVAALTGAVVLSPVAKKVAAATKSKKDDKVVKQVTDVLDKIPLPIIRTYLAAKGVKVPELPIPKL